MNSLKEDLTLIQQCLLNLLDSPLNKAGYLRIYIRTTQNVLIEINPQIRIPRTFKRFAGLMGEYIVSYSVTLFADRLAISAIITQVEH